MMKSILFHICIFIFVAAVMIPSLSGVQDPPSPSENMSLTKADQSTDTASFQAADQTAGPAVTATPQPTQRRISGEVEHPITHPIRPFTPGPTPVSVPPPRPTVRTPLPTPRGTPPVTTIPRTPPPRTTSPTPQTTTPERTPTPVPTSGATTSPTTVSTTAPTTSPTVQETTAPTPTPSPTPVTTVVVTVTVPVYRYPNGRAYSPVYYYPPGYGYPITSYYPSGTLTVTSNPSDAIVLLDGTNSETTPWIYTNLVTGYHTVEVDYPGYEAYVTNVYVDNGASPEVDAELTPLQTYGSMLVDSSPEGAGIFIDGNYEGITPTTVGGLSPGLHQVEAHLAGYMVQTQMVTISSGQGNNINIAMQPYSTVTTSEGSIEITSNVPGALVYLDGIYKGAVKSGNTFDVIAISPGSHTLLLHSDGFTDFTQTIDVSGGQVSYVTADLGPVSLQGPASATQTGSLVITSSPAGGQVFLDNVFRGVAPVTIYDVAPGDHIVNMKLAGYSDWSGSATVQSGQVAQVAAQFAPSSAPAAAATRTALPVGVSLAAITFVAVTAAKRKLKR